MSYWYCATPYSLYAAGIDAAYQEACRQTAVLIRAGIPALSPIAHSHGIATHGGINPLDHQIWMAADHPLMSAAKGFIVCMLDGWDESYGVSVEIAEFERAGKPIHYMYPGRVPDLPV